VVLRSFVDIQITDRQIVYIKIEGITNCPNLTLPNLIPVGNHLNPAGAPSPWGEM
jgi:hypothetical protein